MAKNTLTFPNANGMDLKMDVILSGSTQEANIIHKAKTLEPPGINKRDVP